MTTRLQIESIGIIGKGDQDRTWDENLIRGKLDNGERWRR
jgi:hypothetical protein